MVCSRFAHCFCRFDFPPYIAPKDALLHVFAHKFTRIYGFLKLLSVGSENTVRYMCYFGSENTARYNFHVISPLVRLTS